MGRHPLRKTISMGIARLSFGHLGEIKERHHILGERMSAAAVRGDLKAQKRLHIKRKKLEFKFKKKKKK